MWTLVTARPRHLLQSRFSSWDSLFSEALDRVLRRVDESGQPVSNYTWGKVNRLNMRHRLSRAVPIISWLYDLPPNPLAGDIHMPLAQTSNHGPVLRMVVTPGREEQGIMQMPGGQASNPQSAYYRAGHSDWETGRPTSFLPGPTYYSLQLVGAD